MIPTSYKSEEFDSLTVISSNRLVQGHDMVLIAEREAVTIVIDGVVSPLYLLIIAWDQNSMC